MYANPGGSRFGRFAPVVPCTVVLGAAVYASDDHGDSHLFVTPSTPNARGGSTTKRRTAQ